MTSIETKLEEIENSIIRLSSEINEINVALNALHDAVLKMIYTLDQEEEEDD